jgi:RNA polymerase sigma factor (sigma-70 family)
VVVKFDDGSSILLTPQSSILTTWPTSLLPTLMEPTPATRGLPLSARQGITQDEDLVRLYLVDIGRHPLLTREQEVELAKRIEAGKAAQETLDSDQELQTLEERRLRRTVRDGDAAREEFILSNLRLVVSIARRYRSSGVPIMDLVQEGNFGLMHAVGKFDWRKGFKFSTYATWWIRQSIERGIDNLARTIRLPGSTNAMLSRVMKARNELEAQLRRPVKLVELAEHLDLTEEKVSAVMQLDAEPLSLTEGVTDEGGPLSEIVADWGAEEPFDAAASSMLPADLMKLLEPLNERERRIIWLRFGLDRGEPRSLAEVAEHFNLTRERIRQLEVHAMAVLRRWRSDVEARDLLGA